MPVKQRPKILQVVGSVLFTLYIYVSILVFGVIFLPVCLVSRSGTYAVMKFYSLVLFRVLRFLCNIHVEIRGTPPTQTVLVASKHQSFLDVMMLMVALPRCKFIMKRELLFAPLFGLYAWRIGTIPVRRNSKAKQIPSLVEAVQKSITHDPGQVVIYPEGTRVKPGQKRPYKRGVSILYDTLRLSCVPVATNVGCFWGKNQLIKKQGVAVLSFLQPIPPGVPAKQFLLELETKIENASDELYHQALSQSGDCI